MEQVQQSQIVASNNGLVELLDKTGWGVALIWIGAAILLDIGWSVGLFGLGVIIFAGQLLRRYFALNLDWFALAMGFCLLLAGAGPALGDRLGEGALLPILSIALGAVFLFSALFRKRTG